MTYSRCWSLTVIALALVPSIVECSGLARGWGNSIKWLTLDKAKEMSIKEKKPVMVIIHKSWCGACKDLKKEFARDKSVAKYSSKLLMVNLQDDEEPEDEAWAPDGGYVPRIFFLSPASQKVETTIVNAGAEEGGEGGGAEGGEEEYKYFYYDPLDILDSMKKAVKMASAKKTWPVDAIDFAELVEQASEKIAEKNFAADMTDEASDDTIDDTTADAIDDLNADKTGTCGDPTADAPPDPKAAKIAAEMAEKAAAKMATNIDDAAEESVNPAKNKVNAASEKTKRAEKKEKAADDAARKTEL